MKTPLDDNLNKAYEAFNQNHDRLRQTLLTSLPQRPTEPKQKNAVAHTRAFIGDTVMKSKITKLAAAAVIIIGVLIGVYKYGWTIDGTSVAWADVVEKIKNINEVSAESWRKFTVVGEPTPFWEGKVLKYFSRDLGYVDEQYIGEECVVSGCGFFPAKRGVIILHGQKKYFEFDLNEDILFLARKFNPLDLYEMIAMCDEVHWKRLGFKEIKGIKTKGFEIKVLKISNSKIATSFIWKYFLPMENLTFQVWVDTETSLPIELQAEALIGKGLLTGFNQVLASEVYHDIKWGSEIDPKVFEPIIPGDYNMVPKDSLVQ